jgi:hypothetical protein
MGEDKKAKTLEDIIAYGGIAESQHAGLRSSDRLRAQSHADATQLERAMMLAQRRDELLSQGTAPSTKYLVLKFSNDDILSRASGMGVSLGVSLDSKLKSVKIIKDTELQRSLPILKKAESSVEPNDLDSHNLVVSKFSNLCDDLVDEENCSIMGDVGTTVSTFPPARSRTRKVYDKSSVRRSKRLKILKSKNISKYARS